MFEDLERTNISRTQLPNSHCSTYTSGGNDSQEYVISFLEFERLPQLNSITFLPTLSYENPFPYPLHVLRGLPYQFES